MSQNQISNLHIQKISEIQKFGVTCWLFRFSGPNAYPGQLYYEMMGVPSLEDSYAGEAFKRDHFNNPRDFIKKSISDNKQIRFHQCYFNPISCFR